jgi:hypothetical protein
MIMVATLLSVLALAAVAAAATNKVEFLNARMDDSESADEGDARTVFTSNGQYFLALNTTALVLSTVVILGGLLAAFTLFSLFSNDDEEID